MHILKNGDPPEIGPRPTWVEKHWSKWRFSWLAILFSDTDLDLWQTPWNKMEREEELSVICLWMTTPNLQVIFSSNSCKQHPKLHLSQVFQKGTIEIASKASDRSSRTNRDTLSLPSSGPDDPEGQWASEQNLKHVVQLRLQRHQSLGFEVWKQLS